MSKIYSLGYEFQNDLQFQNEYFITNLKIDLIIIYYLLINLIVELTQKIWSLNQVIKVK